VRSHVHRATQVGELVVAAFDKAASYSSDPREVSRLATQAVAQMLRRARRHAAAGLRALCDQRESFNGIVHRCPRGAYLPGHSEPALAEQRGSPI